jgi:hypothetical protein
MYWKTGRHVRRPTVISFILTGAFLTLRSRYVSDRYVFAVWR